MAVQGFKTVARAPPNPNRQAHARRVRCAAFAAVAALVRATQTKTQFYAAAMDSKDRWVVN